MRGHSKNGYREIHGRYDGTGNKHPQREDTHRGVPTRVYQNVRTFQKNDCRKMHGRLIICGYTNRRKRHRVRPKMYGHTKKLLLQYARNRCPSVGIQIIWTKKMKYNPEIHKRKSIRLQNYDYSSPGAYFIRICTQNRSCLLGKIINNDMKLNNAGIMIQKWYHEIENKYKSVKCGEHVIMPNHFHCIIEIHPAHENPVGTPLCGHPHMHDGHPIMNGHQNTAPRTDAPVWASRITRASQQLSLFNIMDWFKTMTTNEYIRGVKNGTWLAFDKRVWQKRYWDHIIRNNDEYDRIRLYINNNPLNWKKDKLNNSNNNCVMESSVNYNEEIWMV